MKSTIFIIFLFVIVINNNSINAKKNLPSISLFKKRTPEGLDGIEYVKSLRRFAENKYINVNLNFAVIFYIKTVIIYKNKINLI